MSDALLVLLIGGSALGLAGVLVTLSRIHRGPRPPTPEAIPSSREVFAPRECPPLLFPPHSSQLSPDARRVLRAWADELSPHPEFRIVVVGSADTAGNPSRNRSLARQRAQEAARVLTAAGISPERLDVQGREPEPGSTEGERSALRCVRVGVKITSPHP